MPTDHPDPYTLTIFTAQSGAPSARLDHEDGSLLHLHSLVDPEKETSWFSDLQFWGDRVILAGCGLGYHLKRAIESLPEGTSVLLVEYYETLAERCLERFPQAVRDRVTVLTRKESCTPDTVSRFLAGGRYVQVVKHPPSWRAHREYYLDMVQRFSIPSPLSGGSGSVLLMQGTFFLEKELAAAAAPDTATVQSFHYADYESVTAYESQLQKRIQTDHPKVVISVNMLGIDGNGILPEYCRREGIPLIVWFVDDPQPILLNRRKHLPDDTIVFTWERTTIPWLRLQGFGNVRYLPLAADPAQFASEKVPRPTVGCGFIGTAMARSFLNDIAAKFMWKREYAGLAAAVAVKIAQGAGGSIDSLIEEECRRASLSLPSDGNHTGTWLRSYILHTASMIKRKMLITGLLPFGIETFGDPEGWREVAGPSLRTHGNIDYRSGIADCYRSIIVNINSTSCQMPTGLNQRVFDVPVSGAFILNDNQDDLHDLFDKKEYVAYVSIEDCREKVVYYREHEGARSAVTAAARKRILAEHTYAHRLRALIQSI